MLVRTILLLLLLYYYFTLTLLYTNDRMKLESSIRGLADDNPMKLMSIAMKPLTEPPFPLERIREMTALMGGEGSME